MNINIVIMAGRLTRDPELKALPSGMNVASFGIAINRTYTTREGKKESVEFVDVVAFGNQADVISRYLKRGQVVLIEGRWQTRSWEKDGEKRHKTEVVADRVQFGPKAGAGHEEPGTAEEEPDQRPPAERAATRPKQAASASGIEYPSEDINPDDIPF